MKHIIKISILTCLLTVTTALQGQVFEWVKSAGGNSYDEGNSIAVDELGNVYITGSFQDTVDFDPGVGTSNLISNGVTDVFIQKLDSSGNFIWAKSFGGTNWDYSKSIAVDTLGNVYTTGTFVYTVDFDPGAGTSNLSSVGLHDIYIQKLDSLGNFLWAKSFGDSLSESGNSIALDAFGNVYTTGNFDGTIDFDPGAGTLNLTSINDDIFIQKLDALGNFLWAKSFGDYSDDAGISITLDTFGNVYTTGRFKGTVDFDPGAGTSNLTTTGNHDVFIQKLDASGSFLWAKSFGNIAIGNVKANSITVDALGNVYTTGSFTNGVDFNPGAGSSNLSSTGGSDTFVQKLDASGNFLWVKSFRGTSWDYGSSISLDALGNIYTTGRFQGTVDFDPGLGISNLTSGGSDIFVHKMDPLGNFIWVKSVGGFAFNAGTAVAVDALGNIFTTGHFWGTVDFDHGTGTSNLTSLGNRDIFVLKMSPCVQITGVDVQTACDSYTWIDGNTYTASNNSAMHTLTSFVGCDSVVTLDLTIINSTTGIDIQTACDSLTWTDGITYTTSNNTATDTLTNIAGCDSVITLNLSIINSNTGIDWQTACNSYTWIDGNTYTASSYNTVTDTLINISGCDSVVTLFLTINNPTSGTDTQAACGSYTWIDGNTYSASNNTAMHTLASSITGCDSVVTLNLTINNSSTGIDTQIACDSYTWIDGNIYTASNNSAMHTLTNISGCDSVVTLNLTINSVSDITTSLNGLTITATNSNASYQWLDCNNNYSIIDNETNQTYMATANGSYSVELIENGCVDTTNCLIITNVGIVENSFGEGFVVYPNPTSGNFSINLGKNYGSIKVRITDVNGKLIRSSEYKNSQTLSLNISEPTGIYIIRIESAEQRAVIKLVKQ